MLARAADGTCAWCGERHAGLYCHLVKAVEFFDASDLVKRVEFILPADVQPPPRERSGDAPETSEEPYEKLKPMDGGAF